MAAANDVDTIIWRNCAIGAPDAETDKDLLSTCFVDNGCIEQVVDLKNPASIILGRTGAGKSATLVRLDQTEDVIKIDPIDLSFRYVENSTIIRFFRDNGVNLDIFYRLLWRHVLITELLRHRYQWESEASVSGWFESMFDRLKRDPGKAKALRYLQRWGDKFWQETEVRVQEVTQKVESEFQDSIGAPKLVSLSESGKLTDEQKQEIHSRGSNVVNQLHIKELSKVLDFLSDEVFEDQQRRVFVTIDGLDEGWVSTTSKFHLIRALMEEIKTFRKVGNVKIVAALRQDLLETVYSETRDGGFQEEKFEAYFASIRWKEKDLEKFVDIRVGEVFKRQYTNKIVTMADIFPKDRGSERAFSYVLDRTFLRPRDVMLFVNECLNASEGKVRITWRAIQLAEGRYSQKRYRSLLDEWIQAYPSLKFVFDLLRGMRSGFAVSDLGDTRVDNVILKVASGDATDEISTMAARFMLPEVKVSRAAFLSACLRVLYHVGVVGVKVSSTSPFEWAYRGGRSFVDSDLSAETLFRIHKMFWRELGISSAHGAYESSE